MNEEARIFCAKHATSTVYATSSHSVSFYKSKAGGLLLQFILDGKLVEFDISGMNYAEAHNYLVQSLYYYDHKDSNQ